MRPQPAFRHRRPVEYHQAMAIFAFAVKVPSAGPFVGDLRPSFDAMMKLAVPAHITARDLPLAFTEAG